jgi:hypothetical protein
VFSTLSLALPVLGEMRREVFSPPSLVLSVVGEIRRGGVLSAL